MTTDRGRKERDEYDKAAWQEKGRKDGGKEERKEKGSQRMEKRN